MLKEKEEEPLTTGEIDKPLKEREGSTNIN
jgi:hypothetical protein